MHLSGDILEEVKKVAERKTLYEEAPDSNPFEASGGNYDDAYGIGYDDGLIAFARFILRNLS